MRKNTDNHQWDLVAQAEYDPTKRTQRHEFRCAHCGCRLSCRVSNSRGEKDYNGAIFEWEGVWLVIPPPCMGITVPPEHLRPPVVSQTLRIGECWALLGRTLETMPMPETFLKAGMLLRSLEEELHRKHRRAALHKKNGSKYGLSAHRRNKHDIRYRPND